ncbi:MAG TPA: CheR family methyltransferase [Chloroflexia bacterium]|nr:CheR family methyltransferase [Chloroflexia bacterium]
MDLARPTDLQLSPVSAAIAQHLGLHFPPDRWADLARILHTAAPALGYADGAAYSRALLEGPWTAARVAALAPYLTVGETYFFREPQAFETLEIAILPALIQARRATSRQLRVWSAGCCTGEEAYSLAIWLRRVLPDWRDWHLTILATDLNPQFLQQAAAGIYGEWSFRATPAWVKGGYFQPAGPGTYALDPAIKQMVSFAPLNLAGPGYPSAANNTAGLDLIFCRNVLMYFTPDRVRQVIQNLHQALSEGGVLVVSSTELSPVLFGQFRAITFPRITLYRKEASPPPASAPSPGAALPGVPPLSAPPLGAADPRPGPPRRPAPPIVDARALALRAQICADQGRLAAAQDWIDQAIAADDLDAAYHYLRATILQEQGAVAAALDSFRRALYLDPQLATAHFALGHLLLRQGKTAEAARHFAQVRLLAGKDLSP